MIIILICIMIFSYLIKNIEENISVNQALQETISKINHKIQIANAEAYLMENFLESLQNSISYISKTDDLDGKYLDFNHNYYFYRKVSPTTVLRRMNPSIKAQKLIECLYIFMNKNYKDWDHFLNDYNRNLLWDLTNKLNDIAMKLKDEQLMKISQTIEELDKWSSKANYELTNIYFWIKRTHLKILKFKAQSPIEKAIEEISKQLILKKEELAWLDRELQDAISFQSKI
ncbi:unnamed protein product [Blepharisma stoltei]|uniref:Uncharacterized protein n=1 Tax=Blepharisma stoltei TaxID=1481888 RepID=A0AAU9KFW0_9CILI|nr:unnamed protein product [Blepharisma stoltei]